MQTSIVGFGELGRQFLQFLNLDKTSQVFFFDDLARKNNVPSSFPFDDYLKEDFSETEFYVSLGYFHLERKHKILQELKSLQRKIPKFVHPSCFVNISSRIAEGVFVYPMCNIDQNVEIREGSLLNNSVVVSHDSLVGSCCYISPSVVISGNVSIGDYTFIGSGSIISNKISIGRNVKIGIGTVVTENIPDNTSVIGNPMKIIQKQLEIL